jgi:stage II sporulation protein D
MARVRTAVLGLLVAALGGALAESPAPAAKQGPVTWVVRGGGYGHGVGLSAYGAYGFGLHGRGYRQILHHYYRGVRIAELRRAPLVRVLLDVSSGDVSFSQATAACGRTLDRSTTYRAHARGSSVLLLSGDGRRLLARCGARLHADSAGVIQIQGLGPYRGALEAVPAGGGSLNVVNALNANNYVRGSVALEVPPEWPMATLKTFAVAARSIALSTDVGGRGYELYADTRTQMYGGVAAESARTDRAARLTRGEVITYRGEVAQAFYFSASGGRTEPRFLGAPRIPYLQSVADPYDRYSPLHRWTFRFSQAEMNRRLGPYVPGALRGIRVTQRGDSPRIDYARLIGTAGSATIRGDTLAAALGLYDRWAYFKKTR